MKMGSTACASRTLSTVSEYLNVMKPKPLEREGGREGERERGREREREGEREQGREEGREKE